MRGNLEVLDGGILTTIQDSGRVGYRKYGVPVSGVMDDHAFKLANWLVGNNKETPVFEMTLKGGKFEFKTKAVISITGGESELLINGNPLQSNKTKIVESGDILQVGKVKKGIRVYLAIRGKWNIVQQMGSYSTYMPAKFGGLKGRRLQKKDTISWETDTIEVETKVVPKKITPYYSTKQRLRIIEGPEWSWLTEKEQEIFLNQEFDILTKSNRMGIKLEQSISSESSKRELKSAPVIPGIIQLPNGGSPIILMKDAQLVGGYPRIAKVVDADLWRLGQVWKGVRISFNKISTTKAIKLSDYQNNLVY